MGSEFGIKEESDKMRLTPGAPGGGAGRWMLAGWSAVLAVVCLTGGIGIGYGLQSGSLPFMSGTNSDSVETYDLTNALEETDRRALMAYETPDGRILKSLRHNTAYYDSISQLTVVKQNGWIYSFVVQSYNIKTDTSLVFNGVGGEELTYPSDGSGWKMVGAATSGRDTGSDVPLGRRLGLDIPDEGGLRATGSTRDGFIEDLEERRRRLSSSSSLCDKSVESVCKNCIETEDSWCGANAWDASCTEGCDGKTKYMSRGCEVECAEPKIVTVTAKKVAEVDQKDPIDCVLESSWSDVGTCSFLTGSSKCYKKQTKNVVTQPQHGGKACDVPEQQLECECFEAGGGTTSSNCGDGHKLDSEECDDGNGWGKDGCDKDCKVEPNWDCSGGNVFTASTCTAVAGGCGDGTQAGAEECDDGNTDSGDGCSSDCKLEPYFDCEGGVGKTTTCECMRVRKDYRDMSDAEKTLYIAAVNDLKQQGIYDLFVQVHAHLTNKDYAHGTSGFLPWHRKYLLEYENAIRRADGQENGKYKCVTVPYWDWAEDTDLCAANAGSCKTYHEKSDILKDFGGPGSADCMTNPHSGNVGGGSGAGAYSWVLPDGTTQTTTLSDCTGYATWGSTGAGSVDSIPANAVGCVRTGPFAGWISPEFPYKQGDAPTDSNNPCLSRGLNWHVASQGLLTGSQRLKEIIYGRSVYGTNGGFRAYIESTPHANPHNLLGGHIRSFSSPADPLFFSHHAFIDKVWSMWQNCHDHDEATMGNNQYQGTSPGFDGPSDPLVFKFFPETTGENKCVKTNSACATHVHAADSWCASNNWDATCEGFCSSSSDCGDADHPERNPQDVLKPYSANELFTGQAASVYTWDSTKLMPGDFHSIHDLGDNSYLYAEDQFDKHNNANPGSCNWSESSHHGKKWKTNRRRMTEHDAMVPTETTFETLKATKDVEWAEGARSLKGVDENGRPLETHAHRVARNYKNSGVLPPRRVLQVAQEPGDMNEICPYDCADWVGKSTGAALSQNGLSAWHIGTYTNGEGSCTQLGDWYSLPQMYYHLYTDSASNTDAAQLWPGSSTEWIDDRDGDGSFDMDRGQEFWENANGQTIYRYECTCQNGLTWDMEGLTCIDLTPTAGASKDPDADLVRDYYDKVSAKFVEENEFVKDSDSLNATLSLMVERECKLLYNKQNKIKREDAADLADTSTIGKRGQLLKNWGLEPCSGKDDTSRTVKCIDDGVAEDPCDGIGGEE
ncbi:hypothetical protein TrVE_jg5729 [Triparma verrucosa]|uniref:Tyrosinase copper-binding domain-containing protein n=1 Tax=Triparma verrucosa TaxID=1606542 RepID=A0A9W7DLX2_9STRA|nr:hypothetical protein TrVE_jg5729 [Triparma verrucosa]